MINKAAPEIAPKPGGRRANFKPEAGRLSTIRRLNRFPRILKGLTNSKVILLGIQKTE